jgi:hypothetical protein
MQIAAAKRVFLVSERIAIHQSGGNRHQLGQLRAQVSDSLRTIKLDRLAGIEDGQLLMIAI